MKPVPKIAVLIVFIGWLSATLLNPPRRGWLFADYDAVEEVRGLGEPLFRRKQAVFMFDRKDGVVAKHAQCRNKFAPPLRAVTVTAGAEDPTARALVGVWL